MTSSQVESDLSAEASLAAHEISQELYEPEEQEAKPKPGFLSMGELDEFEQEEDPVWKNDDITSLAHGELEQHRELRAYARIAAWEMPLLSSKAPPSIPVLRHFQQNRESNETTNPSIAVTEFAKPFTPPPADAPLRFRYTTYMGESHPGSNKIVLELCTHDLPTLTPAQRLKLIKLAGVRYNPSTDIIKMSSEMFPTQAQNKRYLGDLIDTLIAEAQDPTDTFADVPLDFRHHKWKRKPEFPEGWKLTEARKKQLEADRTKRAEEERERLESGRVVHGVRVIEEVLRVAPVVQEKVAVKAPVGKGKAKRPKRLV